MSKENVEWLAHIERWLFEVALPLWAERGFDSTRGGFVERLGIPSGAPDSPFKRMRVQARQVYVYCQAHLLGLPGPGLEIAARGLEFMKRGWRPDRGWARTLSPDGDVTDDTLDLYDQAFVLFALGWYLMASGEASAGKLARETLECVHRHLRHPTGEGYMHVRPPTEPWQQNPHMHMLEAAIVLARASGDDFYLDEAHSLFTLMQRCFFDPDRGTLAEYYDAHWRRAQGDVGRIVEPGHHFEWSWLLWQFGKLTSSDVAQLAIGLFDFADRHGTDARTGLVYDEVRDDGSVLKSSIRLWPQTEALKAHLSLMQQGYGNRQHAVERIIRNLFSIFLDKPAPGMWLDRFASDYSTPTVETVPASSLYHIMVAFGEVIRSRVLLGGLK